MADRRPEAYDYKNSVLAATTSSIDLRFPGEVFDGVTLDAKCRILVKDQSVGSENGIYEWRGENTRLVRAGDMDQRAEVSSGLTVFVEQGDENGYKQFVLTTPDPVILGTTELTFEVLVPNGGGGGVQLSDDNVWTGHNTFEQNVDFGASTNESYLQAGAGRLKLGGPNSFLLIDGNSTDANPAIKVAVDGDDLSRFEVRADGLVQWGDGGPGGLDVDLYRHDTSTLRTGGHFIVGGFLTAGGGLDINFHAINNLGAPVNPADAATKQYVDDNAVNGADLSANNEWTGINTFDNATVLGGGIAGNLSLGGNQITNLAGPTNASDAATKQYVDDNAGGGGVSLSDNNTWTGYQSFDLPVSLGPGAYFAQHNATDPNDTVLQAAIVEEPNPRLRLRAGQIEWGDGTNQTDTYLFRDSNGDLNISSMNGSLIFFPAGDTIFNQTATFNEVVDFNVIPVSEGEPTQDIHVANKAYVDNAITAALPEEVDLSNFTSTQENEVIQAGWEHQADILMTNGGRIEIQSGPGLQFTQGTSVDDPAVSASLAGSPVSFDVTYGGKMRWGSGAGAPDASLERTAPGILSLGSGNKIQSDTYPSADEDLTTKAYVDGQIDFAAGPKPVLQTRGTRVDFVSTIDPNAGGDVELFPGGTTIALENTDDENTITATITAWCPSVTLIAEDGFVSDAGFRRRMEISSAGGGAEFDPNWVHIQYMTPINGTSYERHFSEGGMFTYVVHISPGSTANITLSDYITILDSHTGEDPLTVAANFSRISATGMQVGNVQGWPTSQQSQ